MAIEKMKLISITGNGRDLDFIIANDLIGSGIQPENALKILEKGWKLTFFTYNSEVKNYISKAKDLLKKINIPEVEVKNVELTKTFEEIKEEIDKDKKIIDDKNSQLENKNKEIEQLEEYKIPIEHLQNLNWNLEDLYNLRYMNFRYGKMTLENYEQMQNEIEHIDAIILELEKESENVWFIYFTPEELTEKVDSYFKVMKFERIWLPEEITGNPLETKQKIEEYIDKTNEEIKRIKVQLYEEREMIGRSLIEDILQLEMLEKINRMKKYIAHDNKGSFYIVGWIPDKNVKSLKDRLEKKGVECVIKNHDEIATTPPTKLKNNVIAKPFEAIVKMYGIPNYTEMDPTTFVAITSFLMFGFMFGDVGQGLIILLIGIFLVAKRKNLGPLLIAGGISAMIFGVLYGSVFGKEDIIKGIVPSPMDNITNMLVVGIAIGAILIIIAMLFNIKNGIRSKDKGRILFDKNGLAGLIFYITILVIIVGLLVQGKMVLSLSISLTLIILPLILIIFKEKIENLINKSKEKSKPSIIEKIFEVVEMLLSMASNTISFVRLAAFAINHVGLCMAVYILADMVGGTGSMIVAIIGNAIVIALEGLIVAVQVLRLEYYELFSRFYTGDGREYIPIENQEK